MTIFYKGLIGTQTENFDLEIKNINGFLLLRYPTQKVVYDAGDLMFCMEEYINNCNVNVQQYFNYISIYIPQRCFPKEDYYLSSNRIMSGSDRIDPYKFVTSKW